MPDRNSKNVARTQSGMTLVEVMVTAGIASVLMLALAEMVTQSAKSQKGVGDSVEVSLALNNISAMMSNPSSCNVALKKNFPTVGGPALDPTAAAGAQQHFVIYDPLAVGNPAMYLDETTATLLGLPLPYLPGSHDLVMKSMTATEVPPPVSLAGACVPAAAGCVRYSTQYQLNLEIDNLAVGQGRAAGTPVYIRGPYTMNVSAQISGGVATLLGCSLTLGVAPSPTPSPSAGVPCDPSVAVCITIDPSFPGDCVWCPADSAACGTGYPSTERGRDKNRTVADRFPPPVEDDFLTYLSKKVAEEAVNEAQACPTCQCNAYCSDTGLANCQAPAKYYPSYFSGYTSTPSYCNLNGGPPVSAGYNFYSCTAYAYPAVEIQYSDGTSVPGWENCPPLYQGGPQPAPGAAPGAAAAGRGCVTGDDGAACAVRTAAYASTGQLNGCSQGYYVVATDVSFSGVSTYACGKSCSGAVGGNASSRVLCCPVNLGSH